MKYYDGAFIDKQKRVCLGGYVQPNMKYVIYMTDNDDRIFLELFDGQDVPEKSVRKADIKGRMTLPKFFFGNATRVLIGKEKTGQVVLKPIVD